MNYAPQTGILVSYDGGAAATTIENGFSNVVIGDITDDSENAFGIMLNAIYGDSASALGAISYTYTLQLADNGPQTSSPTMPDDTDVPDNSP